MTTETPIQPILFYCKECQWIVQGQKHAKKYEYTCPICKGDRVVFGTREAIVDFFHIKEAALNRMLANPDKKND